MKSYCLGFVQSLDGTRVLLMLKHRPRFLAGMYNGIGGQIEEGETPVQAMCREAEEEADLRIPENEWVPMGTISDGVQFLVHVFSARTDLSRATSMTDEPLEAFTPEEARRIRLAPDVMEALERLGGAFARNAVSSSL